MKNMETLISTLNQVIKPSVYSYDCNCRDRNILLDLLPNGALISASTKTTMLYAKQHKQLLSGCFK